MIVQARHRRVVGSWPPTPGPRLAARNLAARENTLAVQIHHCTFGSLANAAGWLAGISVANPARTADGSPPT